MKIMIHRRSCCDHRIDQCLQARASYRSNSLRKVTGVSSHAPPSVIESGDRNYLITGCKKKM